MFNAFFFLKWEMMLIRGEMANMVPGLMERLRPLVGLKSWDYCVLWKLTEDQRLSEIKDEIYGFASSHSL